MHTRNKGIIGEKIARRFLEGKGYVFVESNFYSRFGEIDLVMRDFDVLVFCEVKMRSSEAFGSPLEAINYKKQVRIWKTAQCYLQENVVGKWRIDVVGIMSSQKPEVPVISHIADAFQ